MNKSPIEIAIGQTNILIEDEVCKAVGKVGIHINKKELLKALKAYEFVEELTNYIFEYPDDDYMTMECLCRKLAKHGFLGKVDGYYQTHEKRTNTHECVKDTRDKTENSSEKPNNCEVKNYCDDCLYNDTCDSKEFFYACTSKAIISKMEQVEDEPQTCSVNGRPYDCGNCEYFRCTADEPQTERSE